MPSVGKSIEGVVSCGRLDFLLCSVGDLNPVLGFYIPLFSMVFPRKLPSEVENGLFRRKQNCCKSTYTVCLCFNHSLPSAGMIAFVSRSFSDLGKTRRRAKSRERRQPRNLATAIVPDCF